jgi:Uri superfamily endonuclease
MIEIKICESIFPGKRVLEVFGTYILILKLAKDSRIKIGRLGILLFSRGYYCYVGSALGKSMSIENRTARHKKLNRERKGRLKWHIDYFLVNRNVSISDIIVFEARAECEISRLLKKSADQIEGFGCSDCKCKSHFYYFGKNPISLPFLHSQQKKSSTIRRSRTL